MNKFSAFLLSSALIAAVANANIFDRRDNDNPCESHTIEFFTDRYPEDNAWSIINLDNREQGKMASSSEFNEKFNLYQQEVCLPSGTYVLAVTDSHADGLCCDHGRGYYRILNKCSEVVLESDTGDVDFAVKDEIFQVDSNHIQESCDRVEEECTDHIEYPFRIKINSKSKTCRDWQRIGKCDNRIHTDEENFKGKFVRQICRKTCDACKYTNLPEIEPILTCEDDIQEKFRWKKVGGKNKTCAQWAEMDECDRVIKNADQQSRGRLIWQVCKQSCDRCPSASPTASPTQSMSPSESPTFSPTAPPTQSMSPSESPTFSPTAPGTTTGTPTESMSPSELPTHIDSFPPTGPPTEPPTRPPTGPPTGPPTSSPTDAAYPSSSPTDSQSTNPTAPPTGPPSRSPTRPPTGPPTASPTDLAYPSSSPTDSPSTNPTAPPTGPPTASPPESPTPTASPTDSAYPSSSPTDSPSTNPTASVYPSEYPSSDPTND